MRLKPRNTLLGGVLYGLGIGACGAQLAAPSGGGEPGEWVSYGGDPGGARYSALDRINRDNVRELEVAWTYRTGEARVPASTDRGRAFEATPLVVDGTMYIGTPLGKVIALDPITGAERWRYDAEVDPSLRFGDFANRGVSTWLDASAATSAACRRRVFIATIDARLIALDAATGRPCAGFGRAGAVDLRRGLRNPPEAVEEYEQTSPPAVVNGLVVVGSSVADNSRVRAASGEVRAFDARTGALRWTWEPVPQDPDDPAYDSWRGPNAHDTGAANAWSIIVVDPERNLVFVPTGSPSPDYYGGLRRGDNRYANSVTALDASTGEVVWSFQTTHHDLWDYDVAAPPALAAVVRDGESLPAVLVAPKTGMLFVLDRMTGEPLFPVEERAVPESTIPGEETSPTQPFTVRPAPLSPARFTADDAWGVTADDRDACRAQMQPLRNDGIFTPPSLEGTLVVPSNVGGPQWGGTAVDEARQIAVIPVNRVASMVQLIPAESFDPEQARADGERERYGEEFTRMRGTPYVMHRRILLGPSGLPCTPPPWGTLVAVNLETAEKLWEVPLGSLQALSPEALPEWGSLNLGGPIVTAGGLVFIGASLDASLHAYDIETGEELWRGALPSSARATPMTYLGADGRQYVSVAIGGGGVFGDGDALVTFGLPREQASPAP